jgi:pSer/pThr/pTyr-binding forkhead associated (FHA) protein
MKLIIEDDEGRRTVVPLLRDELIIGRADGSFVRLPDRDVSRRHARLLRRSGRFYLEDLDSFTGVRVNGERLGATREVREGDLIEISQYDLKLEAGPDEKAPPDPDGAGAITAPLRRARRALRGTRARIGTFVLILLVAAALAAALWLREARGAEGRAAASKATETDRISNRERDRGSSRGSVPPDSRDDVR